ncbi:hypothetical protein EVAR_93254_1 [Eumeta japonica]|uniref:Uncharacterized protein n=1 Tax=Eumeta variegata TaxID=151549 RepID=A0A4C1TYZ9_EUMVA|nr:hypothetical protein EVAR_93254_1 [Eumeta japonica]
MWSPQVRAHLAARRGAGARPNRRDDGVTAAAGFQFISLLYVFAGQRFEVTPLNLQERRPSKYRPSRNNPGPAQRRGASLWTVGKCQDKYFSALRLNVATLTFDLTARAR